MTLNKKLFGVGVETGTKIVMQGPNENNYFAINSTTSSGKYYFEVEVLSVSVASTVMVGLYTNGYVDGWKNTRSRSYYSGNGNRYKGTTSYSYGNTWGFGDTASVAFDGDNDEITFYLNGTSQGLAFSGTEGDSNFGIQLSTGLYAYEARLKLASNEWKYSAPSGFGEWTAAKTAYDNDNITTSGSSKQIG